MDQRPCRYLDELAERVSEALTGALRGVYLTGSAAVGAYRPGASDLDVLVACEGAGRSQLEALVRGCAHEALPCPATKLELVVYEDAALGDPGKRPRWKLNFNTGASVHHVGFDADAEPAHWFVVDLAFAHRHARALIGPPAEELIGTPADEAIDAALEAIVNWYEENEPEGVNTARKRAEHWRTTRTFMAKPGLPSKS